MKSLIQRSGSVGIVKLFAVMMVTALGFIALANSQMQPTAQQLEYFQSLSPAEQQQLAKKFGVNLPPGGLQAGGSSQQQQQLQQTIHRPSSQQLQYDRLQQNMRQQYDDTQSTKTTDGELPIFGMDVFAGQITSFTPIGDLPVPADYIVAPGDEINIQVYGKLNEQYELIVGRDGQINIPNLGPFSVVGKRFSQVRDELHQKFEQQIIGAKIAVSMGQLHAMQIYVLGDANQPGAYQLSSLATASQAIIAAGGIADTGSLRQVEVRRGNNRIGKIDLYDMLINGDRGGDMRLQSGDVVFIPPAGPRVSVEGEVRRPAIYELSKKSTSLQEIVTYAGGALPSALRSRTQVERQTASGKNVFTVDASGSGAAFSLTAGDRVVIAKQNEGYRDSIQLVGAFTNAGQHGFSEGMRVSDVFSHPKTVLRDDADASLAILIRKEGRQRLSVRYISIFDVLENPDTMDNYVLQPEDELVVLPAFVIQAFPDLSNKDDAENDEKTQAQKTLSYNEQNPDPQALALSDQRRIESQKLEQFVGQASTEYEARQRRLAAVMALRDDTLSAKDVRAKREALEAQATKNIETRRAELLSPIIEKLREQSDSETYQQVVDIVGEVKYPGSYPYAPGMSLETLIKISGGMKENAYSQSGELARLQDRSGAISLNTMRVGLDSATAKSLILQARDKINIFEHPEWRDTIAVRVTGEVRFPGTYTVARGTGFKELIERTGGLTEFAFPEGGVFSRESLKQKEQEQIERLRTRLKEEVATLSLRKSSGISGLSVSPSEAIEAVDKLSNVEALGRLVVDLPALLAGNDQPKLSLEDGDVLHIPTHSRTVTVVGEVQYPSSHLYEKGVSYKEYLERAGGTRQRADRGRIYIIRANGQVQVAKNSWFGTKVKEGDTIVVPINAQYVDKLSVFGTVSQILYQLGVAYDVVKD